MGIVEKLAVNPRRQLISPIAMKYYLRSCLINESSNYIDLVTDAQERVFFASPNLVSLIVSAPDQAMPEFMDSLLTRASSIFCQTHVWPLLRLEGEVHEIFLHLRRPNGTSVPVMTNVKKVNF